MLINGRCHRSYRPPLIRQLLLLQRDTTPFPCTVNPPQSRASSPCKTPVFSLQQNACMSSPRARPMQIFSSLSFFLSASLQQLFLVKIFIFMRVSSACNGEGNKCIHHAVICVCQPCLGICRNRICRGLEARWKWRIDEFFIADNSSALSTKSLVLFFLFSHFLYTLLLFFGICHFNYCCACLCCLWVQ